MPKPTEIIETDSRNVACDGGGGALGHPLVYLTIGDGDEIMCPYCSRLFRHRVRLVRTDSYQPGI